MFESALETRSLRWARKALVLFLASIFFSAASLGASAQAVHEPGRGSEERGAILNTLRPVLEVRVGPPVEFVVNWIRSGDGWAFVHVSPQRPGGSPIDLRYTTLASQVEYMDNLETYALLRFQYSRWNLVDFVIGPTDVFWQGDPLYNQLPRGLTPH